MELVADLKSTVGDLKNTAGEKTAQQNISAGTEAEDKKEHLVNIDFKMVTFSLADKDYAVDIMRVKEIAKAGHFTYVPNTAYFVLGVYNLRGDIIPIIDLRIFFGIPVNERKNGEVENMLIVTVGEQTFGIVVDAIDKVVGIQKSSIQPPHPLFGDINIKFIYGVVESNERLYVLLDIERIFGIRPEEQTQVSSGEQPTNTQMPVMQKRVQTPAQPLQGAPQKAPVKVAEPSLDYTFIADSLHTLKKFTVSPVNETWVNSRFNEWLKQRGKDKAQLANEAQADEFLIPFYSQCNGRFWTKEYADAVFAALPENTAKQINVWNPGCGKGYESFSLACILKRKYPESRIRIYAQDLDLLNISNAPMLSVPQDASAGWLAPYLSKNVSGSSVFAQEIKDIVLFEYHDCMNATNMPTADIIICRDVISFLNKEGQEKMFQEFSEKLKGNGILLLGDKETINGRTEFDEKMVGSIVVITKK